MTTTIKVHKKTNCRYSNSQVYFPIGEAKSCTCEIYANRNSNYRILKVEEVGDFWRKNTKPRIRLKGKWMINAGILPNNFVQVSNPQPGVLILQMVEEEV